MRTFHSLISILLFRDDIMLRAHLCVLSVFCPNKHSVVSQCSSQAFLLLTSLPALCTIIPNQLAQIYLLLQSCFVLCIGFFCYTVFNIFLYMLVRALELNGLLHLTSARKCFNVCGCLCYLRQICDIMNWYLVRDISRNLCSLLAHTCFLAGRRFYPTSWIYALDIFFKDTRFVLRV